ncbi:hypothetical protein [Leptospira adleri]|uniref:Uncharacterized protein n=1 Tax=Leptospira adleri TaxID=2023186 RepID=A0A2M9YNQ5_9LEPT|nr:hypothetical protein [Leptospira adleri]PJZ53184.1 hypothetical protein CH380_10235 [Leptospira adleri]PJZ59518.1 hypothetical protein CH376_23290 [Leptospira adleri]
MNVEFNNLPWHDAELLSIEIDRSSPGKNDSISLLIKWPDKIQSEIIFTDCYGFNAKMNFGFICDETILKASMINDQEKLYRVKQDWKTMGVDLKELKYFEIETNTTASLLAIYALDFRIKPEPDIN